jgi:hypothetical protein
LTRVGVDVTSCENVSQCFTELADWLRGWAPNISHEDAATIAAVGVNALLGKRAMRTLFHATGADVPDERYIPEWTAMLAGRIQELR